MTRASARAVTFRAFDPQRDYPAAAAMICASHLHDGVDWLPTAATLEHEWRHAPTFDPATDARLAEADGQLVGIATESWRRRGDKVVHNIEIWVRPEARRQGIGNSLAAWAEARAAERVAAGTGGPPDLPHELGGWGDEVVDGAAELAAKRGYRVVRYGMEMRRPIAGPIPEAPLPDGLEVRPVVEADHRRIWEADVEAFRDHWEAADRDDSDFAWWFAEPDIDTTLWQVAWDGDEVAGSIWTWVYPDENARLGVRRAWLQHISVRRPWRRRGLAGALIASTLRLLRDRGLEEASLGVDAENPSGAVRLYERMGFRRHRTGISYRKALTLD